MAAALSSAKITLVVSILRRRRGGMDTSVVYSSRASLALVGLHFQVMNLSPVVRQFVHIKQKVHQYDPVDKLLDAFINILAGGHGVNEINTRVRPDLALQYAFGLCPCADQSTISRTLNVCTADQVAQLRHATEVILRQYGRSYVHDYQQRPQLLDVDLTGLIAGRLGEGVTKGYFAEHKNARGRQLGRVLATHYDELVVDQLYPGRHQLHQGLPALIQQAESALNLSEKQRENTIVRIDGGGGTDPDIDWLLGRQYHVLLKVKNWNRAQKLADSVTDWVMDTKVADRALGWVSEPHAYVRPTRQLAIRTPKPKGGYHYQALVFTLPDSLLFELGHRPMPLDPTSTELLRASIHAYDQRDGGVETHNRGDKQGLGLNHRNKHRFAAQEMLVLLVQLAHNFLIWIRNTLAQVDERFLHFGMQRLVRDVLQIDGHVALSPEGAIRQISLNDRHPLAAMVQHALWTDDLLLNLRKI
jgi:hypothetical protein